MTTLASPYIRAMTTPARQTLVAWSHFWFDPISPVALGLFRILYGVALLLFVALLKPEIFTWFSDHGMMRPASADKFWGTTPHWSLLLWYPQRPAVALFFAGFTVAVILLTIGLWTRTSTLLVLLGLISLGHRNPLVLNGTDIVLRVMAVYLVLAPAGAALSVDRLRAIARGRAGAQSPLVPAWTVRLMQLQVSLIYASTVLLKLKGQAWSSGIAVYYTSRLEEFHRFPVPFLAHSLLLVNIATYLTLAVELSVAFLIWIPALRKVVLISGLMLHAGIEYSMNVPQFEYVMLATFVLFCDVEGWWLRLQYRWPLRGRAQARLLVDGSCEACLREARLWHTVDICGRVEFYDAGPSVTPVQPLLVTPGGRALHGQAGWRWLAWRSPALWLALPFLLCPGVQWFVHRRLVQAVVALPAHTTRGVSAPVIVEVDGSRASVLGHHRGR